MGQDAGSGMEAPAFTIHNGDKVFRIFASGRTEGFDDEKPLVIVNRIPELLAKAAHG